MHKEFYDSSSGIHVLAEGAQGFFLDIDWGKYPYVTSSHCGIGGLLNNGFTHKQIRKVYGVVKAYETYVGADNFEGDDPIFAKIRELGQEFGATTGRPRQCNWLSIDELIRAINMTGIDTLIINKIDILNQLGTWKIRSVDDSSIASFKSEASFKEMVSRTIQAYCGDIEIIFSSSPERI
jgi:adenylosuccinate synthase